MKHFLVLHYDKFFKVRYYRQFQNLSDAVEYFLSLRGKVEKGTKGVRLVAEGLGYTMHSTNLGVSVQIVIAQFYTNNNIIETFETEFKSEFETLLKEQTK